VEGCSSERVCENETCGSKIIRKCRQNEKETERKQEINMIGKNKIRKIK
jgi:hypothetical protein